MYKMKWIFILIFFVFLLSCKKDNQENNPVSVSEFTITPSTTYQEMIGFGGALTWYSNNVITSPKSEEIYNLMFKDLGMDILRLKNWYYPSNYPDNKLMISGSDKTMFDATNTFFEKAKQYNPDIKILFSSWGPPAILKSNDNLNEGTLKKDNSGHYMYNEYAQYWVDILDNISFNPDYISIQNEPGYANAGWTTCVWGVNETSEVAAYDSAFIKVHNRIKDRSYVPAMIGPESANVPAFMNLAPKIKNLDYCQVYAFHPYNYGESSNFSTISTDLTGIASSFGNKPNFMTEYSGMSWFKTARFIQQTLKYSNSSAYIYWQLVWGNDASKDYAMIYVDGSGNYTVNPFYYVIKHFAKFIDAGFKRIAVTTTQSTVEVTGYINPDHNMITIVAINIGVSDLQYSFDISGYTITGIKGYQSVEGNYFKDLGSLQVDKPVMLPAQSISTYILNL